MGHKMMVVDARKKVIWISLTPGQRRKVAPLFRREKHEHCGGTVFAQPFDVNEEHREGKTRAVYAVARMQFGYLNGDKTRRIKAIIAEE